MKKTRCHPTKGDTVFCLVGDYAISENFIMPRWILIYAVAIVRVVRCAYGTAVVQS